ncbi:M48 family metallopeptidase [bacterium]|nr:M48 family metallopeptidase [bacterium]
MIRQLEISGRILEYDLERKKVKNLNLRIRRDGTVAVSANSRVSIEYIDDFLRGKADFIFKAISRYAEIENTDVSRKQYVDGESFRIFGHDLRLKVLRGAGNEVKSDGVFIILRVKDPFDIGMKHSVFRKWFRDLCRETVTKLCEAAYPKFGKYGIPFPEIKFRNMISRWGSCMPRKQRITFNYALASVPVSCIEYVVMHEFTHFLHPDHSPDFYRQLSVFMPDWRERKALLEKSGVTVF